MFVLFERGLSDESFSSTNSISDLEYFLGDQIIVWYHDWIYGL